MKLKVSAGRLTAQINVHNTSHKVIDILPKILYRFVNCHYRFLVEWMEEKHGYVKVAYILNTERKRHESYTNSGESRKSKKRY